MEYSIHKVCEITGGNMVVNAPEKILVEDLVTDNRKIIHADTSLFFAIKGERHDGHKFIESCLEQGVCNFMVSEIRSEFETMHANFIVVDDTLEALQVLSSFHRLQFSLPVTGITGSNGKTIVKEWLYQLMRPDKNIVRSPKSYNSQVGVPLSVWQISPEHQLALIEAGISKPGEMEKLRKIILPTIGIFTNIGTAHDENFATLDEKVNEKLKLFASSDTLIYCRDYNLIQEAISGSNELSDTLKFFTWSRKTKADLQVGRISKGLDECEIQGVYKNDFIKIRIPFTDDASVENAIHCWSFLLLLGYDPDTIDERMQNLSPVAMRLEMKEGINNCSIINDSYNSDIGSLTIALDFLNQQKQHKTKTIVLSDILQSGKNEENLYGDVAELLKAKGVDKMIGIGDSITRQQHLFNLPKKFYQNTDDFLRDFSPVAFRDETILIKGARPFGFEKISKALQQKAHETVLEINLNALVHNLNYYRSRLKPTTKIMAMVKAFSYGSGSFEIANILQFHHVDYLAVAYTDEGVELRKTGITLPIMVMNPEVQSFEAMIQYKLEPEIYNFRLLNQLGELLKRDDIKSHLFPIHLKLDTGMHRLGFEESDIPELMVRLRNNKNIRVQSVFSHLAASDEAEHDSFTKLQIEKFSRMSDEINSAFDYHVCRHLLNSSGVIRFQEAQFDMVRLGIGLYGFAATTHEQAHLQNVATLKTTISQIKNVPATETIGYSRKGILKRDTQVATVAIGYADGINRRLSNGAGKMLVKGKRVPVIGHVCMDMCMLDITDVHAKEGDEVIVFGAELPVQEMAKILGTISYEILVNVSQRVKRVYFHE
ncbi:MAG: bifunctional UDP-N-acetylmuramoyl-tripeptide:D-alanyl-D-alanine ligase/alanine racemase [Bacteroidetes bacterium]|nr:bifunctional UDP-N-acetylmuramoyl-tripeptide:D-alanyl-D-alanine ligase/alanine racemase [Bacteroidota bacterium]